MHQQERVEGVGSHLPDLIEYVGLAGVGKPLAARTRGQPFHAVDPQAQRLERKRRDVLVVEGVGARREPFLLFPVGQVLPETHNGGGKVFEDLVKPRSLARRHHAPRPKSVAPTEQVVDAADLAGEVYSLK